MLKDDKTYPYLKVTVNEEYPRVLFVRQMKKDKAKYFGPYTSSNAVKDSMELIRKLYHVRTCNRNLPRDIGKERPCCIITSNSVRHRVRVYFQRGVPEAD